MTEAVKIANLQIEISDNSKTVSTSLKDFITTLQNLKDATTGGAGLNKVAKGLINIKNAGTDGLADLQKALTSSIKPALKLANAMERIERANKSIQKSGGLQTAMQTTKKMQEKAAAAQTANVMPNRGIGTTMTANEAPKGIQKAQEAIDQATKQVETFQTRSAEAVGILKQLNLPHGLETQLVGWINKMNLASSAIDKVKGALLSIGKFGHNVFSNILPSGISRLIHQFTRLAKMKILRTIISNLMKGFSEGLQNAYYWAKATGDQFAISMDSIATNMNYAKNTIGAAFATVLNAVAPVIDKLVDWLVTGINYINMFFSALGGSSTYLKAKKVAATYGDAMNGIASGASGATGAVKELEEQLSVLDFDELNQLSEQNVPSYGGGGSPGGGSPGSATDYANMFERAGIDNKIKSVADFLRNNFDTILDIVKAIGAGILAWKLATAFSNSIKELSNVQKLGIALMVTGFTLEFQGAYDIGLNGANTKNVIQSLIGSALGIAGSLLTFGTGPLGWTIGIGLSITTFIVGLSLGRWEAIRQELYNTDEAYRLAVDTIEWASEKISKAHENMKIIESHDLFNDAEYGKWMSAAKMLEKIQSFEGVKADSSQLSELQTYVDMLNKILEDAGLDAYIQFWTDANGVVHTNAEEIQGVIDNMLALAKMEAYKGFMEENFRIIAESEITIDEAQNRINELTPDKAAKEARIKEIQDAFQEMVTTAGATENPWQDELDKLGLALSGIDQAIADCNTTIEDNKKVVEEAEKQNQFYMESLYGVSDSARQSATDLLTYNTSVGAMLALSKMLPKDIPTPYMQEPKLNLPTPQQTPMYAGMVGYQGANVTNTTNNQTNNKAVYSTEGASTAIGFALAYTQALQGVQNQEQANLPYQNALEQTYFSLSNEMDKSANYGMAYKDVLVGMNEQQSANANYVGSATNKLGSYITSIISAGNASQTSAGQTGMINTELNKVGVGVNYAGIANAISTNLGGQNFKNMGDTRIKNPIEGQVNLIGAGVSASTIYNKVGNLIGAQPFSKIGTSAKGNIEGQMNMTGNGVNANAIYGTVSKKTEAQPWANIGRGMAQQMATGLEGAASTMRYVMDAVYNGMVNSLYRTPWSSIGRYIGEEIKNGLRYIIGSFDFTVNVKANGKSYNVGGSARTYFAAGGYPQAGTVFVAGEAGAEAVGTIGGKTGVANRDQIASAIAQALKPMLGSGGGRTETIEVNTYLDSAIIAKANAKGQVALKKQFNMRSNA